MKIGIITLPFNSNYGGILQNFSLQTVLKEMGHEVTTIEKINAYKLPHKKRYFAYTKRIILRFILQKKQEIFFEKIENDRKKIMYRELQTFINKYIHLKRYPSFQKINESEYDALVVGSDQVWRPLFFKDIENAYLNFAQNWNITRISYAASFGTDHWEYNKKQTIKCKKLISLFDQVSVRESHGVQLCNKYFDKNAIQVLDPTLLLPKEEYIKICIENQAPKSKGNLLVYILDENKATDEIINVISNAKGLKPFTVNNPKVKDIKENVYNRIQPKISQWIRGFYDAEFVITDSFHACVFSIIFEKPFLAYGNAKRGLSRFTSLLSLFHLENRMILNIKNLDKVINDKINWEEVNTILHQKQEESINFLKANLIQKKQTS